MRSYQSAGDRWWVGFLGLCIGLLCTSMPVWAQSEQAAPETPAAASAAEGAATPSQQPAATPNAVSFSSGRASVWDQAKLEKQLRGHFARAIDVHHEYERELEKSGMGRLVDGPRIQQDKTMAETRQISQEMRRVVAEYRKRYVVTVADMLHVIDTAPLEPAFRKTMAPQYRALITDARDAALKSWDREQETIDAAVQLAEMLWASRARWTSANQRFAFTQRSDLNEFRRRMGVLSSLVMAQTAERQAREQEIEALMKDKR